MDVNHFSTFALNGQDGSVRWHHLPGDFNEMKTIDQVSKDLTKVSNPLILCPTELKPIIL